MPKGSLEKRIAALRELRRAGPVLQTTETLKAALGDRSNLIVAQAAKMCAEFRLAILTADLTSAFDRMMEDGAIRDPQCLAKQAVVDALTAMEHSESSIFLRGMRHVQMEPVMGGHQDTAPPLRARSVLALVQCSDLRRVEALRHIVDAITDPSDSVRIDALRALEQFGGDDSALLLRLKARVGDEASRVVGQALESLLTIEGETALPFVAEFLESVDSELFEEAALVLGASRLPEAFRILRAAWERDRNRPRGDALLRIVAASRRPDGIQLLISLIEEGSDRDSAIAQKALEVHRDSREIQEQVRAALRKRRP